LRDITNNAPEACTTYDGDLDKGERKICKDDRVYYLIEKYEQISVRRNFTENCNNFIIECNMRKINSLIKYCAIKNSI
jgi:hypothetical protein